MQRPSPDEHSDYFGQYVSQAPDGNILESMRAQADEMATFLESISEEKAGQRYAPDKWSLKQVVGHLIDSERIFVYRMLAIARGESQSLPGFEQDDYVETGHFDARTMTDLAADFASARASFIALLGSLEPRALERRGTADGKPVSARAIPWIQVGHTNHHRKVMQERYL